MVAQRHEWAWNWTSLCLTYRLFHPQCLEGRLCQQKILRIFGGTVRTVTCQVLVQEIPCNNTKKEKGPNRKKKKNINHSLTLKNGRQQQCRLSMFRAPRCPSNSPRGRWHSHSQLTIYPSQMLLARKQVRNSHRSRWPQAFLPIFKKAVLAPIPPKKTRGTKQGGVVR